MRVSPDRRIQLRLGPCRHRHAPSPDTPSCHHNPEVELKLTDNDFPTNKVEPKLTDKWSHHPRSKPLVGVWWAAVGELVFGGAVYVLLTQTPDARMQRRLLSDLGRYRTVDGHPLKPWLVGTLAGQPGAGRLRAGARWLTDQGVQDDRAYLAVTSGRRCETQARVYGRIGGFREVARSNKRIYLVWTPPGSAESASVLRSH